MRSFFFEDIGGREMPTKRGAFLILLIYVVMGTLVYSYHIQRVKDPSRDEYAVVLAKGVIWPAYFLIQTCKFVTAPTPETKVEQ